MKSNQSVEKKLNPDTRFDIVFNCIVKRLIENDSPSLTLQDLLNRYIGEHGIKSRYELTDELGFDDRRMRRYLSGKNESPKDYKDVIKICICLNLSPDDAKRLMIHCGHPPESFREDKNRAAHYAVLDCPGVMTITEWNEYLMEKGYAPLD